MADTAAPPQRLLIVRPSALGDVARTVPALVSLRAAFPQAVIDWLVRDSFAEAVAHHPALSGVVPFPRSRFRRFGRSLRVTRQVLAYLRELRGRRYDAVYDLQGLSRSGWLTWATGAPKRIGAADARELAWLAYNRRVRLDRSLRHTVDRMLGILAGDGVRPVRDMRLYVGEQDRRWADAYLAEQELEPDRYTVLAPTARWRSKRWPIERFGELADGLGRLGFDACVIVGGPNEREQTAPLTEKPDHGRSRCLDLVGRTTVGRLMALIERCGLLVGNDSAALHLALGLGRRAVGIFGPTDPEKVGPYRYPIGVVRAALAGPTRYRASDQDTRLIDSITVERVAAAVETALQSPPPSCCPETEPASHAVS